MTIRFKSLKIIPITFLNLDSMGIQWELEETLEPPSQFEFFVERSGSPQGPFQEIAGPLDATTFIDTTVNRFSKHREIFYRVRAKDKVTSKEFKTTDIDSFPQITNYENDRPRGSFTEFEEFTSGAIPIKFTNDDLRRLSIIRRNNLLLRRFSGIPTAILKARTFGQRCPDCFDEILRRATSSKCFNCFGTGFTGGYFDQINIFVDFDIEPKIVRIEVRGEVEDIDDTAWASNFPLLSPRDLLVRPDGKRWLVVSVRTTELRRAPVRQMLLLRLVNPNEDNIYKVPVERPEIIDKTEFIGFTSSGGSGLL